MLLTALSLLRSNWRLLLLVLVVVAVLGMFWWSRHQAHVIAELRQSVATAETAATENAKALAEFRAQAERDLAVVTADREAALQRLKTLNTVRGEIARAPAKDDAPVAPVLLRAVDSLRQHSGATGAR